MRGQDFGRAAASAGLHHLLPQGDAGAGVVAGLGRHDQAQPVSLGLVRAAVIQAQQLRAHARGHVAHIAQPQQGRPQAQAGLGGEVLAHLLARMLQQRVRHLVAHDGRRLIVAQLQFGQDAPVEGDLAARHAEGVDLRAADQVDLPLPVARALVALRGEGDHPLGHVAQPLELRVVHGRQRALAAVLLQHLTVLLRGGVFHLAGRHRLGEARTLALRQIGPRRRNRGAGTCSQQAGEQPARGAPCAAGAGVMGRCFPCGLGHERVRGGHSNTP